MGQLVTRLTDVMNLLMSCAYYVTLGPSGVKCADAAKSRASPALIMFFCAGLSDFLSPSLEEQRKMQRRLHVILLFLAACSYPSLCQTYNCGSDSEYSLSYPIFKVTYCCLKG